MSSGRIIRPESSKPAAGLGRIGKIKIGQKVPGQTGERPVSLDYFRATGDYAQKFKEVYGDKPTNIKIVFMSDEPTLSCLEEWDGRDSQGRRAGYGDGRTTHLWNGKEYVIVDKDKAEAYSKEKGIKWNIVLTLNFIIPAISGVLGLWTFSTKGDKSSIPQIRNTFDTILERLGTVVNVPFDLCVRKVKSQNPGSTLLFPVVTLVPNISQESIEVVKNYLSAGNNILQLGMLTDEKVNTIKALPPKPDELTDYEEVKEEK